MEAIKKSGRLKNVRYDIRGPVAEAAKELEKAGEKILKLNIGNPAVFGFNTETKRLENIKNRINDAQGYVDSQGIVSARQAIVARCRARGFSPGLRIDDVFIGNGVSELISMTLNALLDKGDEVLLPRPDYPLWSAATILSGGRTIYYRCDEMSDWLPDLDDLAAKVTKKTVALILINPNNPTGSVYPRAIIEKIIAFAQKNKLALLCDETYDRVIYDDAEHVPAASLSDDTPIITFNGLSKVNLACGFRAGWLTLTGPQKLWREFREGLNMLANMRLCSNVFAQLGIEAGLEDFSLIKSLCSPGGRLKEQRDAVVRGLRSIPGLSCVEPKGTLYVFPKIDIRRFNIKNDEKFVLDFLRQKHVLLVPGSGFNWDEPDHFRVVFLPEKKDIQAAMGKLKDFLAAYSQ